MKTIKEIQNEINKIDRLDDDLWQIYRQDSRKGVGKLVNQRIKQIEKLNLLKEKHYKRQEYEIFLNNKGFSFIAGVDEVGRGPLAGPVVAAAVILPLQRDIFLGINDSKQLSLKKREEFVAIIKEHALAYSFGVSDNRTIDEVNIYQATKIAMEKAVNSLEIAPDYLLIDAMTINSPLAQKNIVKGDQLSLSIAAASILAKDYRDNLMQNYSHIYPEFDFTSNVGYGTANHLKALDKYGYTPIHRQSFEPVKSMTKQYNFRDKHLA